MHHWLSSSVLGFECYDFNATPHCYTYTHISNEAGTHADAARNSMLAAEQAADARLHGDRTSTCAANFVVDAANLAVLHGIQLRDAAAKKGKSRGSWTPCRNSNTCSPAPSVKSDLTADHRVQQFPAGPRARRSADQRGGWRGRVQTGTPPIHLRLLGRRRGKTANLPVR